MSTSTPQNLKDIDVLIDEANQNVRSGRLKEALAGFKKILATAPQNLHALAGLGVAESLNNNHSAAIEYLKKAHKVAPEESQIIQNLGHAHMALGLKKQALSYFEQAYTLNKADAVATFWIASLSEEQGDLEKAERHYRRTISLQPDNRQAYLNLSNIMYLNDDMLGALTVLRLAERQFPGVADITFLRDRLVSKAVPGWHLPMIEDTERNNAYEAAIQAKVRPGDIVLDIGTGSGLLAMMAARAGAKHVYACEMNPVLASLAQEVILRNGFQDKITVIAKHSKDLVIGKDLPCKADFLVTETFDSAIVGEGALESIQHAHHALLKENARVVPESATLYGALAQCPQLSCYRQIGTVNGFDLGAMNALTQYFSHKDSQIFHETSEEAKLLSKPFTIKHFEFESEAPHQVFDTQATALITENGTADSIHMWFDLQLAPNITFTTAHYKAQYHWRPVSQLLLSNTPCQNGEAKTVNTRFAGYFNFHVEG